MHPIQPCRPARKGLSYVGDPTLDPIRAWRRAHPLWLRQVPSATSGSHHVRCRRQVQRARGQTHSVLVRHVWATAHARRAGGDLRRFDRRCSSHSSRWRLSPGRIGRWHLRAAQVTVLGWHRHIFLAARFELWVHLACDRQMPPGPSLQPTCYGLRPPHAAELKRWAATIAITNNSVMRRLHDGTGFTLSPGA